MPATDLNLSAQLSWTLATAAGAFGAAKQGSTSQSWQGIPPPATWTQVFQGNFWIPTAPPSGLAATLAAGGTLNVGTTYYYVVTALGPTGQNGAGAVETSASNEASVRALAGQQTASLSWSALQGATSYNVYRGTAPGMENVLVAQVPAVTGAATGSYNDTGTSLFGAAPPASMPNNYVEFSLASFDSLFEAEDPITAGHALCLFVVPTGTGATCVLTPGATNGFTGFWVASATPGTPIPINGVFLLSNDPAAAGYALSSGQQSLRITNGGTAALTVAVLAFVGP